MAPEDPPMESRAAALAALKLRQRREPVIDLIAEEELNVDGADSGEGSASGLRWHFEGEGCVVTLNLDPAAAGWLATAMVEGQESFHVTVFRSEGPMGPRVAEAGEAALGLLTPGPLSLTCRLTDRRSVQTAWVTLPRPPMPKQQAKPAS